jgi:hypothetical protein
VTLCLRVRIRCFGVVCRNDDGRHRMIWTGFRVGARNDGENVRSTMRGVFGGLRQRWDYGFKIAGSRLGRPEVGGRRPEVGKTSGFRVGARNDGDVWPPSSRRPRQGLRMPQSSAGFCLKIGASNLPLKKVASKGPAYPENHSRLL